MRVLGVLQFSAKKTVVYGSIAVIWIVIPTLQTAFSALINDIVLGTCTRFPVNNNTVVMKTVTTLTIILSFFLPLTLMMFCYARIVLALRSKVIYFAVLYTV